MGKGDGCSQARPPVMMDAAQMASDVVRLRAATDADRDVVRSWTADEATQEWLGDSEWVAHVFSHERVLIAEDDAGVPVGMVSGDDDGHNVMLSVLVAPSSRRTGVGSRLLRKICEEQTFGDRELMGEASWRNTASVNMLMASHFVEDEIDVEVRHSIWTRPADKTEAERQFNAWRQRNSPTAPDDYAD